MLRNLLILAACAAVVALPFAARPRDAAPAPSDRDGLTLVVISPHNEAIRREFGAAFSAWHQRRHGRPVRVDWRVIGGTSEIMRYLESEYASACRAWWLRTGHGPWPAGAAAALGDATYASAQPPAAVATNPAASEAWLRRKAVRDAFHALDDPAAVSCGVDVLFGGGTYDHHRAFRSGLTVAPWPRGGEPPGLFAAADGATLIPEQAGGETWRTEAYFGTALSTFGICYNVDRLRELGIAAPPRRWADLADPAYVRQIGVGDPTKSGSLAKAFEMIIHEQCYARVLAEGFDEGAIDALERHLAGRDGGRPAPDDAALRRYNDAVAAGWLDGVRLVQRIGANARYFTDSAGKVPIDVSQGDAAAGLAIDFFGRYQAGHSLDRAGRPRMFYVTPVGGSSVSADPISLLRGARHRQLALRFIEFTLCEEGQRLWNYRPGTPGGPRKFALRRLPVRADFYPSTNAALQAACLDHSRFTVDNLAAPDVNPYALAAAFTYRPRWTGAHFDAQRLLIRAMCMDAGDELQAAWDAILARGGPSANPRAMEALGRMPDRPEPLTWASAPKLARGDRMELAREWVLFFRRSYTEARRIAEREGGRAASAGEERP